MKGNKKMKKIDKRVAKYVVVDTETTNSIECPLAYDIGFAVIDSKGREVIPVQYEYLYRVW